MTEVMHTRAEDVKPGRAESLEMERGGLVIEAVTVKMEKYKRLLGRSRNTTITVTGTDKVDVKLKTTL